MEQHLFLIIRFVVYMVSFLAGLIIMIRAGDNNGLRRVSLVAAMLLNYFNYEASNVVYLLIGSTFETITAAMAVVFLFCLLMVIALFPVIAVVRWFVH